MRKFRKLTTVFLAILMIVAVFPITTALAAEDVTAHTNVTTSNMIIKTSGGAVIDPGPTGDYTDVPKDARVFVEYAFDLLDDNGLDISDPSYEEYYYYEGDYIIVQLPYAVLFEAPPTGWNILAEGTSDVMGVLAIDDNGVATITFTDYVETHSSMSGWFNLDGNFKAGTFSEGDPVEVTVEFAGEIINIGFREDPSTLEISCDKTGVYDPDTNQILWTITVTPNKPAELVTITDTFSSNQTFVPNSFTADGVSVPDTSLNFASATSFDYDAGTLSGETLFTYMTTPTLTAFAAETGDREYVYLTNTADVYSDGVKFADDNATVSFNWIQKTGAVAGTSATDLRIINWTVTVNNNNYDISNAIIDDVIPAGLELLESGGYTISVDGVPYTSDLTGNPGTYNTVGAMTVFLGDITQSKTLTFSTRVIDDTLFMQNGTTEFINNAYFYWSENPGSVPSDGRGVDVGRGVITKTAGSTVNYLHSNNSVITWTLQINANQIPISGASFEDVIPAGLEYVDDSFDIDDPHATLPDTFAGTFNYESSTRTLSYVFASAIDREYTATFDTEITDFTQLYINQNGVDIDNTVTLYGSGILNSEVPDEGNQYFNSQVISKSVIGGGYNYETKRVAWSITVNRNEIPMYNAELNDNIPVGMSFLPETFAVTPSDAGKSGEPLEYTLYPVDDITNQDSFKFEFKDTLDESVTITYETLVKEDFLLTQGTKTFSNTGVLTADNLSASATAQTSFDNYMVEKKSEYTTGGDFVEWAVIVNAQGISLTDLEASDVLQEGLEIDLDSVVLYPMTLAADGDLTRLDTPLPEAQYVVTYDETTRELTLTIPGTHTGAYQLEFITDVMEDSMTVTNTVVFSGQSYTSTSILEGLVIEVDESGLGGTGVQGSVTIEKVNTANEPLSGAVFTLYNNRGDFVAQGTTGENGRVVFGGLPIKTYVLEETSPPPGYLREEQTVRFRMNTEVPDVFYQFLNENENPETGRTGSGGSPWYIFAAGALLLACALLLQRKSIKQ